DAVAAAEAADRPALAHVVARAALMGARGNSGVILSQIVRGVADVLAESTNAIDPRLTARALRGASDAAYRAVRRPVEGTMLSVIRELAEEAERRAAEPEPLGELLVALVRHGEEAVARTPEQLDVLREAGVVDAGGAGLVELLRGAAGAVTGEALPAAPATEAPSGADTVHLEPSRYRYCTVFVVEGEALDRDGIEAQLEAEEAILLPNNPNVRLAAEHAAEQAKLPVAVLPTESIPAGLAALVAYDGTRGADENAGEMTAAAAAVATGEVTRASRDVDLNGLAIRRGDWLGLADGEPVAGGNDFGDVAFEVVEHLVADGLEAAPTESAPPGRKTPRLRRGGPRAVLTLLTG